MFGDQQKIEGARSNKMFFASGQGKSDGGRSERSDGVREKHTSNPRVKSSEQIPPSRKQKVEEAKRKIQNGEYDTQEVYRKIAERLMEHFGL